MKEAAIAERLVQFGKDKRDVPVFSKGCGVPEADALVNNLSEFPHTFVLACLMERQKDWKQTWQIPCEISRRIFLDFNPIGTLARPDDRVHVAAQEAPSLP